VFVLARPLLYRRMKAAAVFLALALRAMAEASPPDERTADEKTADDHRGRAPTVIVLDNERIMPEAVDLLRDGVVVFENHSVHAFDIEFVEPKDMRDRIRCHDVERGTSTSADEATLAHFRWVGDRVAAKIPPGRHASLCSLSPGDYAFTALRDRPDRENTGASGMLPEKGQITVK
jgi:hypothetical protein